MSKKKVLIVEDDAIISGFIQMKLEDMGYSIPAKARSGTEAIVMAHQHQPDLILMDVMLEGEIDGIQAVEEITKTLDIPVIYLTASSDEETIHRLMKTEPHGFLIKPFDDRILFSAIQIAVYRHKTKKELFETKELLRTTIESIDDLVFSLDSNAVFTHCYSSRSQKNYLFSPDEMQGRSLNDVFLPDVAAKLMQSVQWVKDYKKPYSVEFSITHKERVYWFNSKMTLRKGSSSSNHGITMVLSDITESKNMYRELLLSQEKLSETQNIARLGSCDIFLKEKKFVYNDLYFTILGMTDQAKISHFNDDVLIEIMHQDDKHRYKLLKKQVVDEKVKDFVIDYRIETEDGKLKHIHSVGQMFYDHDGNAVRMVNTIQDITAQKVNERLYHEVELAKKTAEMKQSFFARLSHEIRNPVGGITGLLHLLESTSLDDQQNDYIQALKSTSSTLLNLLNDVLDYSRIEAGMMKIYPVEFTVRDTIKNIFTFFIPRSLEKGIEFNYSVQDNLPERTLADESKITQVLSNLLSNAFKFTEKGSVDIRVAIDSSNNDDESIVLRIEVKDTGTGISEEEKNILFRDFSQLDNAAKSRHKGTGLGLAICKQLAVLMGGDIGVQSDGRGKGTTFWFTVPVVVVRTNKNSPSAKPGNVSKKVIFKENPLNASILLVEDMVVNQKVIKLILEEMGCKVTIASNGVQAIEKFRETAINAFDIFAQIHFDIILMDQMMPVMDGVSALQKLKADYEKLPPVIVLTADESFAVNQSYLEKGFDDCIIKPVKATELYDILKKHLASNDNSDNDQKFETYNTEDIDRKPVINRNTVNLILKNAKSNDFNIGLLYEAFVEDMERIYHDSLSAVEMDDNNALRLIVLTVKGLSGNIGASQVHATAKLMDRFIRNDQFDKAKELLPLLTEKYTIFKKQIEEEFIHPETSR